MVEDESILVEMYKKKFSQMGVQVISAFNVREGLAVAEKENPDLIVLDILFPEEDGIFFLKQQKKNPNLATIPVVVLSNYDDPEAKKQALELGAQDYLIKTNYTPRETFEKIKGYLK